MKASAHNSGTRIVISFLVLVTVAFLIEPHLMDAEPPLYVKVLLAPASFLGVFVGRMLPHGNIEQPNIPLLKGLLWTQWQESCSSSSASSFYPVLTYLCLSLLSRFLRTRS